MTASAHDARVGLRREAAPAAFRFPSGGEPAGRFDGYTTFDLQARIGLPVGVLNLGIENLFDQQYITYYAQTTPSNEDYFAGRGRVLSAGWSHRF